MIQKIIQLYQKLDIKIQKAKVIQYSNNEGFGGNKDEPKILDDYMNKGEYSNMYKQLEDIANINHFKGPESKLKTLSKNMNLIIKLLMRSIQKNKKRILAKWINY